MVLILNEESHLTLSVNFDGQFEDGPDYNFQIACVQPPPPQRKIGEGVSVGEGTTIHSIPRC